MLPCKAAANCVDNDSDSHGSVTLSIGSRRGRIPLGERTAAEGSTTTAPFGAVVSKCALREKEKRPGFPERPNLPYRFEYFA